MAETHPIEDVLLDLLVRHGYVSTTPRGMHRFRCEYRRGTPGGCPNNEDGLCLTEWERLPIHHLHKWDERNLWKCPCG